MTKTTSPSRTRRVVGYMGCLLLLVAHDTLRFMGVPYCRVLLWAYDVGKWGRGGVP